MADNDWKKRLGVVFSTNPDFCYKTEEHTPREASVLPSAQKLTVRIDRSGRAGKEVTVVSGFSGPEEELKELGRSLKVKCGTGGSVKDGQILIQGDRRDRLVSLLKEMGYEKAKRGN